MRPDSLTWPAPPRSMTGTHCAAMSTIDDVRAAEKELPQMLDVLKDAPTQGLSRHDAELRAVTDDYAKAIRELEW